MVDCQCSEPHARKRIVLTGGPGAGKTAVLELVRQHFCRHVDVLPESATILFGGGFRRGTSLGARQAAQRAIFHVQCELEAAADAEGGAAIVLCDRGTLDGSAYWPGPEGFFAAMNADRDEQLARYDAVLHLQTPPAAHGYGHSNPVRIESALEAAEIDDRIAQVWAGHPRRFVIESSASFLEKAAQALDVLRSEMPPCCRRHVVPTIDQRASLTSGAERRRA